MGKHTTWEIREGIGILTLNRPEKHNALNDVLIKEIGDIIEKCAQDESVKVFVMQGSGKSFCAGGDLKENSFLSSKDYHDKEKCLRTLHRIPLGLRKMPQPVIACLKGMVGGGGLDLAMGCDVRFASEDARFGSLFTRIGLMPDGGGTYFLPRLVGIARAMEMMLTGDLITAEDAYRIGLVNHLVAPDKLESSVFGLADRLAKGPSQAISMIKQTVYRNIGLDIETALSQEIFGQIFLSDTKDAREGVKAFAENRKPEFN